MSNSISLKDKFPEIDTLNHKEKYRLIVNQIGLNNLEPFIPFKIETLQKSFKKDKAFNTKLTPIKEWDYGANQPYLKFIIKNTIGVNYISLSEKVCILKEAARMLLEKTETSTKEEKKRRLKIFNKKTKKQKKE